MSPSADHATVDVLSPEVYQYGDPTTNGLPIDLYARLREHEPCYRHTMDDPAMRDSVWVVSRHEDIVRIDRDDETFVSSKGLNIQKFHATGGSMIHLDGPDHRRHRGVVRTAFTPRAVEAYTDGFRSLARRIVAEAVQRETFDFVESIAIPMPLNAICNLLDVPDEDRRQLLAWINAFAVVTDPEMSPSPSAAAEGALKTGQYALQLVEQRRRRPKRDLLALIVEALDLGTLTTEELASLGVLLAGAGADTTRNTLSHAIHELMRNPEQMAWIRRHADDIPREAIQEILRWGCPVIHFGRTVVKDTVVAGQEVCAGDFVAMIFPSGNYDPKVFDHPETFDLTRAHNPHVSFGVGPHSCLGKHLAALEIKILLEELLAATTEIQQVAPIAYARDSRLRGVRSLPVTVARG